VNAGGRQIRLVRQGRRPFPVRKESDVIVIFGASSDLGRRVAQSLLDEGRRVRLISRNPRNLDPRAEHEVGDLSGGCDLRPIMDGAERIVSCAHARHTAALLEALPADAPALVLTGSAWRYSMVPDPRGQAIRDAEAMFLASGRNGVILHPTMIYGGTQERNIQRLLGLIRQWPVLPAPGGGRHLVQPIHIEDAAACLLAAIRRDWGGPHAIALAGPTAMAWRDMARTCMKAIGIRRPIVPVPLGPAIGAIYLIQAIGFQPPVDGNVLRRFREDVNVPLAPMREQLGVVPRPFDIGLQQALLGWSGG
jgi:uncharacterized protein YbjT (DUF2867 family)